MRPLAALVPCLLLSLPAFADDLKPVDLDRPGVLERIERDDPDRYAAIRDILTVSAKFPCQPDALRSLQVRHGVQGVECGAPLLTSYPAQRRLSFELEGTVYAARVTVPPAERVAPARAHE